jgi:hypothetical protein
MPEEASGLAKVMWFGVIYLAGLAVAWAIGLYILGTVFSTLTTIVPPAGPLTNSTIGQSMNETSARSIAVLAPLFRSISLLFPVTFVIELAAIAVLTMGFRDLRRVDRGEFSTPSTLMLIMIAGTFVSAAGVLLIFSTFSGIFTTALGPSTVTQPAGAMAAIGSLFLDSILALLGAVLSLVGLIGGLMLGLWRVGSRYDESLLKVAAIFTIIPLLNIVAPILVIVGAHGAKSRLSRLRQAA